MKAFNLFMGSSNKWITNLDLLKSLKFVEAHNSKILFIHTGLSFGTPNPELQKSEILQIILDTILELNVPTICVPTFTFSFCNGLDFDLYLSKSKMGALNEYIRKLPGTIRSIDPLMSIGLLGEDKDLAEGIGHESIGKDSIFYKLHFRDNVRFLFLGTRLGDCFTYMHFMEKLLNVNYRYDLEFKGKITIGDKFYQDTFTLFVRYQNIFPGQGSYVYEDILCKRGIAKKRQLGDGLITILDEPSAFEVYKELIDQDQYFFIDPGSIHDYDKTFKVHNMVAL